MTPHPVPRSPQPWLGEWEALLSAHGIGETLQTLSRLLQALGGVPVVVAQAGTPGDGGNGGSAVRIEARAAGRERAQAADEHRLHAVEEDRLRAAADESLSTGEEVRIPGATGLHDDRDVAGRGIAGRDVPARDVLAFPIRYRGMTLAAVALERGEDARAAFHEEAARFLATLAGWKLGMEGELNVAEGQARRQERWFKTVDAQLRVLDRERQKFLAMVNRGDQSVMVLGRDRRVRWVNPEMARLYGGSEGAQGLTGRRCCHICGRHGGSCSDCPVDRVLAGENIAHQEHRCVVRGEQRDIYATALPIRGPDGQVEEVLVTLQDLSDLDVLRRSERRLSELFERSADAILMVEPSSFRVLRANSTAQALLGYTGERFATLFLTELHPEDELDHIRPHYEALLTGRSGEGMDSRVLTASGALLTCNVCGALFDLDDKQVLMVEMRDVTRVRQLERELAHADRLAALGTMSAGIAHEFKNRLAPLKGFAQLLVGLNGNEPGRVERYAPMMLCEVDRLAALVREVLDFARPQAAQLLPHDLGKLVRVLTEEFGHEYAEELERRRLEVVFSDQAGRELPVSMDADQVRRTFQNIFKNALEACCERGGRIETRLEERDGRAVAVISDTGCGIDPATLERVFEPFYSTKGAKGTGLGMCIVKSLIESNGGSIRMRSRPGEGTEVEVSFEILGSSPGLESAA